MTTDFSTYTDTMLFAVISQSAEQRERAFAELYARYGQKVYLYCTKVMGNRHDANDLYQETWIRFHNAALKAETALDNVAGYLFRIARNLCLNKKRDAKKDLVNFDDFSFGSIDTTLEQKELSELIARALDILDDDYRECFVLHEIEGMPYDELSRITGETVAALKNRVWRARKQVREFLSPFLHEYTERH
ncbi:MAG: RNA polymerase sigma factor [Candidatus Kapabacteria bacterium]|nr:RNA polymerase sigma factor [Candidatus Kapabacteria bacterium]